jgi:hypothetical protein
MGEAVVNVWPVVLAGVCGALIGLIFGTAVYWREVKGKLRWCADHGASFDIDGEAFYVVPEWVHIKRPARLPPQDRSNDPPPAF